MSLGIRKIFALIAVLVGAFCCQQALALRVTLRVDMPRGRRTIGVGDEFHITYTVTDINGNPEQPRNVPGARLLYFDRTGQSSSFQSINGRTSQSVSYTWTATLRATQTGSFTFGPVTVGGHRSNAVSYTIGKAAEPDRRQPGGSSQQQGPASQQSAPQTPKFIGKGDGHLFLRANVSKSTAYEQEALVYTVKLYTTYSAIKFVGATAAPKFEGFVVEESDIRDTQFNYETFQGKTYATAVIARYIIFPQMAGTLKVIGNTYTVSVDQREYYDDPFWGSMSYSTPLQLNVTPNDLSVSVRSLPQPQPADFSGGVGQFSISSSLPDAALKSNQAASIVYTVRGSGNLKYVKLPELNDLFPKEIEVYTPDTKVNSNVGASTVSGDVTFDYSMMPLEAGEYRIPDVTLVYFNPSTGRYERSVAKGYKVKVAQGSGSDKSQTRSQLVFDKQLLAVKDNLSVDHTPYIYGILYWLFYIVPAVGLLGALFVRSRLHHLYSDIDALNARRASKVARARLRLASQCLRSKDEERFYDEMLAALWGYLGDKLGIPTSDLSRENVSAELETAGIGRDESERIIKLIDDCEFAKYAPASARSDMQEVYDQGASVIDSLEGAFHRISKSGSGRKRGMVEDPYAAYAPSADTLADNDQKNSDKH